MAPNRSAVETEFEPRQLKVSVLPLNFHAVLVPKISSDYPNVFGAKGGKTETHRCAGPRTGARGFSKQTTLFFQTW